MECPGQGTTQSDFIRLRHASGAWESSVDRRQSALKYPRMCYGDCAVVIRSTYVYVYIYIPITSYHYKHCTSIGHIQYLLCYRFALTGFGTFHLFPCCTHQIAKCPPHHPSHRSKKCRTHVEAKNSLCSSLTALLSKTRSLWKSLGQHGMMGWNCPEALLNTRAYSSILVLILHKLHKQGSV